MNKQQAYFEKEIVPYRQKIRSLENDNRDIRIENHTLKSINTDLKNKLEAKESELKRLLELLKLSEDDKKLFFRQLKADENISNIMKVFNKAFIC